MRTQWAKIMIGCLAGAAMLGMGQMAAEAAAYSAGVSSLLNECLVSDTETAAYSAGISSLLNECLVSDAETVKSGIGVSAAAKQNTICGYTNLGIADVENHLNIREEAGEDADVVGALPKDAGCEILAQEGDWYKIESGKVSGYVKGEYLLTGAAAAEKAEEVKSVMATSITKTLNARVEPNTDCTIWTMIAEGESLYVIEDLGEWLKVDVDGDECYVASEFVEVSEQLKKAMTRTELRYGEGISDVRVDVVQYACQFIGNRYVWGGTSLTNGVDCSGFTMRIFEKYGIYLPHSSSAQAGYGTRINPSDAKPGDLFFYSRGGRGIGHVAIYIGNGQIVHASSSRTGIIISNAFYRTPLCVTRLLSD